MILLYEDFALLMSSVGECLPSVQRKYLPIRGDAKVRGSLNEMFLFGVTGVASSDEVPDILGENAAGEESSPEVTTGIRMLDSLRIISTFKPNGLCTTS